MPQLAVLQSRDAYHTVALELDWHTLGLINAARRLGFQCEVVMQATRHTLAASIASAIVLSSIVVSCTDDVAPTGDERVAVSIGSAERHVHNRNRSGNVVIAEYPPVFADAVVIH